MAKGFQHGGNPPSETSPVSFALLLNLVSVANAENRDQLWGYISRYAPGASAETHPLLDRLAGYAMEYYRDFVEPTKSYRAPDEKERAAMTDLAARLRAWSLQICYCSVFKRCWKTTEIGQSRAQPTSRCERIEGDIFEALGEPRFAPTPNAQTEYESTR